MSISPLLHEIDNTIKLFVRKWREFSASKPPTPTPSAPLMSVHELLFDKHQQTLENLLINNDQPLCVRLVPLILVSFWDSGHCTTIHLSLLRLLHQALPGLKARYGQALSAPDLFAASISEVCVKDSYNIVQVMFHRPTVPRFILSLLSCGVMLAQTPMITPPFIPLLASIIVSTHTLAPSSWPYTRAAATALVPCLTSQVGARSVTSQAKLQEELRSVVAATFKLAAAKHPDLDMKTLQEINVPPSPSDLVNAVNCLDSATAAGHADRGLGRLIAALIPTGRLVPQMAVSVAAATGRAGAPTVLFDVGQDEPIVDKPHLAYQMLERGFKAFDISRPCAQSDPVLAEFAAASAYFRRHNEPLLVAPSLASWAKEQQTLFRGAASLIWAASTLRLAGMQPAGVRGAGCAAMLRYTSPLPVHLDPRFNAEYKRVDNEITQLLGAEWSLSAPLPFTLDEICKNGLTIDNFSPACRSLVSLACVCGNYMQDRDSIRLRASMDDLSRELRHARPTPLGRVLAAASLELLTLTAVHSGDCRSASLAADKAVELAASTDSPTSAQTFLLGAAVRLAFLPTPHDSLLLQGRFHVHPGPRPLVIRPEPDRTLATGTEYTRLVNEAYTLLKRTAQTKLGSQSSVFRYGLHLLCAKLALGTIATFDTSACYNKEHAFGLVKACEPLLDERVDSVDRLEKIGFYLIQRVSGVRGSGGNAAFSNPFYPREIAQTLHILSAAHNTNRRREELRTSHDCAAYDAAVRAMQHRWLPTNAGGDAALVVLGAVAMELALDFNPDFDLLVPRVEPVSFSTSLSLPPFNHTSTEHKLSLPPATLASALVDLCVTATAARQAGSDIRFLPGETSVSRQRAYLRLTKVETPSQPAAVLHDHPPNLDATSEPEANDNGSDNDNGIYASRSCSDQWNPDPNFVSVSLLHCPLPLSYTQPLPAAALPSPAPQIRLARALPPQLASIIHDVTCSQMEVISLLIPLVVPTTMLVPTPPSALDIYTSDTDVLCRSVRTTSPASLLTPESEHNVFSKFVLERSQTLLPVMPQPSTFTDTLLAPPPPLIPVPSVCPHEQPLPRQVHSVYAQQPLPAPAPTQDLATQASLAHYSLVERATASLTPLARGGSGGGIDVQNTLGQAADERDRINVLLATVGVWAEAAVFGPAAVLMGELGHVDPDGLKEACTNVLAELGGGSHRHVLAVGGLLAGLPAARQLSDKAVLGLAGTVCGIAGSQFVLVDRACKLLDELRESQIVNTVAKFFVKCINLQVSDPQPVALCLDRNLQHYPIESYPVLATQSVVRCRRPPRPLSRCQTDLVPNQQDSGSDERRLAGYLLINPDDTVPQLAEAGKRIGELTKSRVKWRGTRTAKQYKETLSTLETEVSASQIFIYAGHGSGVNFINPSAVSFKCNRALVVLGGCASVSPAPGPGVRTSFDRYLNAGAGAVVGALIDVTAADTCLYMIELLKDVDQGSVWQLAPRLRVARQSCTHKWLVGSMFVMYVD